jgi:rifampicin phosphotransferase
MSYVVSFSQVDADSVGLVGGKGANLGQMTRAGLPVPPGFCLNAAAYREFLQSPSSAGVTARESIRDILSATRLDDPSHIDSQAALIRSLLERQPIPTPIAEEVLQSYHSLASDLGVDQADLPVAVRSSATAEDLPTASFAGQQDTYLNVRGDEALLDHVRRCWASLWTARAVGYRIKQGFEHDQVALAVVVQSMIASEVAGVLFTANPVNGSREESVINASWGLGESIVSGLVTPDMFIVRKSDGAIVSRVVSDKQSLIEYQAGGGTVERDVPAERRGAPSLVDGQVAELAALGNKIEAHYGMPMDIEWGYAGGRFYLLQARAITTLSAPALAPSGVPPEVAAASGDYSRAMFEELFPDPLSPVFLSGISEMLHGMLDFTFHTLGFKPPAGLEAVGRFYCQPYFHRQYVEAALLPLSPDVRQRFVDQVMNPFAHHGQGVSAELSLPFLGMVLRLVWFMFRSPRLLPAAVQRFRADIRALEAVRPETLADEEIVARIHRLILDSTGRLLNYDFLMILLIGITYRALGVLLDRYFTEDRQEIQVKLVSGVTGNATVRANQHIWDLAQLAKTSPGVAAILQSGLPDPRPALAASSEGRAFLTALVSFLLDFGHREVRMDILYPTWGEDPAPVFGFIRGYLDVGDEQSPYYHQERLAAEREQATRLVYERFRRDWRGRLVARPAFGFILKSAQDHTRERDTMHFEMTRLFPPFRRLLFELGQRWATSGLLEKQDDIFFLSLEEMQVLAARPRPMAGEVRRRRLDLLAARSKTPPVDIHDGQPVYAAGAGATAPGTAGQQLRGIAGSPGMARGAARVIMGPEDFGKLQRGEILVAPLTTPAWTPLFAIAGGLVTEVGGILSHGAIVAREYGIPAVMGVTGATTQLHSGQQLSLDGDRGLVSCIAEDGA